MLLRSTRRLKANLQSNNLQLIKFMKQHGKKLILLRSIKSLIKICLNKNFKICLKTEIGT